MPSGLINATRQAFSDRDAAWTQTQLAIRLARQRRNYRVFSPARAAGTILPVQFAGLCAGAKGFSSGLARNPGAVQKGLLDTVRVSRLCGSCGGDLPIQLFGRE